MLYTGKLYNRDIVTVKPTGIEKRFVNDGLICELFVSTNDEYYFNDIAGNEVKKIENCNTLEDATKEFNKQMDILIEEYNYN